MAHPSAEELKIRPLKYSDLDEAMALYAHARQYMADECGNIIL